MNFSTLHHSRLRQSIAAHMNVPLYRAAYLLLCSDAITGMLGLVYWALAARYYTSEQLGQNSAVLSSIILLSGLTTICLKGPLLRFLPVAGASTRTLIVGAYALSSGMAAVVTAGAALLAPYAGFTTLSGDRSFWIIVGLSSMLWCIFALQDTVLTGLRRSGLVPIENALFSAIKLVLLIVLARPDVPLPIVLSWIVPLPVFMIWINVVIARIVSRQSYDANDPPILYGVILRMAGADFLGTGMSLITTNVLPLMVLWQLGAVENARFYLAWVVVTPLLLISASMFSSMTVEIAADEESSHEYGRKAFRQAMLILLPAVATLFVFAGLILSLFGESYRQTAVLDMRILIISTIPYTINLFFTSVMRLQKRIVPIVLTQAVLCATVLGLCSALIPLLGRVGASIAWTSGQFLLAGFVVARYMIHRSRTASAVGA